MHVGEKVMLRLSKTKTDRPRVKKENMNDIRNEHWRSTKLIDE